MSVAVTPNPATGYPMWVVSRAKEWTNDGFTPAQVRRRLAAEHGVVVALRTIKEWVVDGYREDRREAHRRLTARKAVEESGGRLVVRSRRPEYVGGRVVALGKIGLTIPQIEAVVAHDFGQAPARSDIALLLHQAQVEPAEVPGAKAYTIQQETCRTCGAEFQWTLGKQGRPPRYCDKHRTGSHRAVASKEERAEANGATAAPTNPTQETTS